MVEKKKEKDKREKRKGTNKQGEACLRRRKKEGERRERKKEEGVTRERGPRQQKWPALSEKNPGSFQKTE